MGNMVNAERMARWLYPAGGPHIMEYGRSSGIPQAVSEVAGVRLEMGRGEQVANLSQIKSLRISPMPRAPSVVAPRTAGSWDNPYIIAGLAVCAIVGGALLFTKW